MADRPESIDDVIARQRAALDRREATVLAEMRAAYAQALARLERDLSLVAGQIASAQEQGEPIDEDWLRRQGRYLRLIAQAEAEYAGFADDGADVLRAAQRTFAVAGAADAASLLTAIGVSTATANLPAGAVARLVGSFAQGSPLREVLDGYGVRASEVIRQRLVEAVSGGLGARQVARQIARDLDSPATRARMLALVRTETMRSYRGAASEQYQRHGDLLKGLRWLATKSSRTCLACLAMDGRQLPLDYRMDAHVACRCVLIPVTRNFSGVVPETGPEWFARQTPELQRDMLGEQAFAAYQRGELALGQFVGYRHDSRWGTTVRQRSFREVTMEGLSPSERVERLTADLQRLPRAGVLYVSRFPPGALEAWPAAVTDQIVILSSGRAHYIGARAEDGITMLGHEGDVIHALVDPDFITRERGTRAGCNFYRRGGDGRYTRVPVGISDTPTFANYLMTAVRPDDRTVDRRLRNRDDVVWRRDG